MRQKLLWTGLAAGLLAGWAAEPRKPVLVELFTSEGCSSCPPADALLEKLERAQPVDGAQIIVLSEHVDYWNYIGWKDPYSSPAFSTRQDAYARRLGLSGPYTPQMVVDGRAEFVGSNAHNAESAIRAALREPKVGVRILPAGASVAVEVDPLPEKAHKANVYVAYAADSGTSDVLRGENQGRRLHHVAIVRDLQQVGSVDGKSGFRKELPARDQRWIAFVQEAGSGKVWGAAMYPASR